MKKLLEEVRTLQRIAFGRGTMDVDIDSVDGDATIWVYLFDSSIPSGSGRGHSYTIAGWRELAENRNILAEIKDRMVKLQLLRP